MSGFNVEAAASHVPLRAQVLGVEAAAYEAVIELHQHGYLSEHAIRSIQQLGL
jgi:hypothetical protein